MWVTLPRATRLQRLTRFRRKAGLGQRQLVDSLAKQQELPRIEVFVPGAIEPLEQRGSCRFDRSFHRLLDGNFYCAVDGLLLVR
jgi:hypothetical protein